MGNCFQKWYFTSPAASKTDRKKYCSQSKVGCLFRLTDFPVRPSQFQQKQKSTKEKGFMISATRTIRRSFAGIILVF